MLAFGQFVQQIPQHIVAMLPVQTLGESCLAKLQAALLVQFMNSSQRVESVGISNSALLKEVSDTRGQIQQAQMHADILGRLADSCSNIHLLPACLYESIERSTNLQRGQALTLYVFYPLFSANL